MPVHDRPENYPEAYPFSEAELARWQEFWHSLCGMARDRGIETCVLDWNIVVSEGFDDAHDVEQDSDTADVVDDYTRDGLGVSLCDWMSGMTPATKQDWFIHTFVEGIAGANRSVNCSTARC
ncbi:MAG: hypothetical protein V5A44_08190 [Haloarculaceae archaeon]